MPSRSTAPPPWPNYTDSRQESWHRRIKRREKWQKVYSGGIGGIALLSLAVLGLAAASLAQKSQTIDALKGILAWNIILVKNTRLLYISKKISVIGIQLTCTRAVRVGSL